MVDSEMTYSQDSIVFRVSPGQRGLIEKVQTIELGDVLYVSEAFPTNHYIVSLWKNRFVGLLHECYINRYSICISPDVVWFLLSSALQCVQNATGSSIDLPVPMEVFNGRDPDYGRDEEYGIDISGKRDGGFPAVMLRGSVAQWQEIEKWVKQIPCAEQQLGWWLKPLLIVLSNIIEVVSGKSSPSRPFWGALYNIQVGRGGPFHLGWFNVFFPYVWKHDKWIQNTHVDWEKRNSFAPHRNEYPSSCLVTRADTESDFIGGRVDESNTFVAFCVVQRRVLDE